MLVFPQIGDIYASTQRTKWVEHQLAFACPVVKRWEMSGLPGSERSATHLPETDRWDREINHLFGEGGEIGFTSPLEEGRWPQQFVSWRESLRCQNRDGSFPATTRTGWRAIRTCSIVQVPITNDNDARLAVAYGCGGSLIQVRGLSQAFPAHRGDFAGTVPTRAHD